MAKFSVNPLKWFRKKRPTAAAPPGLLKSAAQPRKSGDVFMHLITIQKSLKSMELAMRQQIDFSWLIQKVTGQLSILKLEGETIGEEELAAVAGQVEAYFETISEGRLDFDEKGLAVMLEFTNIYKDAFGDAVSGVHEVETTRLEGWNTCYQALMSKMRPSYEEEATLEVEETAEEPPELPEAPFASESADEIAETPPVLELTDDDAGIEPESVEEAARDKYEQEAALDLEADADFASSLPDDEVDIPDEVAEAKSEPESFDYSEALDQEEEVDDEIPFYDPSDEIDVRDVVISDAEIKSAREYMELGETKPKVSKPEVSRPIADEPIADEPMADEPVEFDSPAQADRLEPAAAGTGPAEMRGDRPPVQLQEVERLKSKLSELHEKREALSSRMSNILSDRGKKAAYSEVDLQERPSIEELDIEDLEDIIFIGRNKG